MKLRDPFHCARCGKLHLDEMDFGIHRYNRARAEQNEQMREHQTRSSIEGIVRAAFRVAGVPELLPEQFQYLDEESRANYLDLTPACPGPLPKDPT